MTSPPTDAVTSPGTFFSQRIKGVETFDGNVGTFDPAGFRRLAGRSSLIAGTTYTPTGNGRGTLIVWTKPKSRKPADVQTWLDFPGENFGWILIGVEDEAGTAARFSTRESGTTEDRPRLIVEYTPLVGAVPAVSQWGVVILSCLLATGARIKHGAWRRTSSAAGVPGLLNKDSELV